MLTVTSIILVLAVVFVNGLTDAPNAIATVVVTRCMPLKKALIMSAFFNFLGIIVMSAVNNSVTETISNIVDFGNDTYLSSVALSSALFSIVLWAVVAWYFGIPTSESHALIAGLTGSGLALGGSLENIRLEEWAKAVKGLFTSCGAGFVLGIIICKIVVVIFKNIKRHKAERFFTAGSILSSVGMSFMHGAQDGQKFIAVLNLCVAFSGKGDNINSWFAVLLCSVIMGLGTLTGGKKIIKSVGMDMVKLQKYQGFAADTAAALSLLLSTLSGFPVSTTHAKTMAMLGAGLCGNKSVGRGVLKDIILTWFLTFPGCILLGFCVTKIFLAIF
ncbi:MAG: anion permease [Acutalibacteraceae bacterium]